MGLSGTLATRANGVELKLPSQVESSDAMAPLSPSVRTGGPARSAAGMMAALAHEFDVSVITSAFDKGVLPMEGVTPDRWSDVLEEREYGTRLIDAHTLYGYCASFPAVALT